MTQYAALIYTKDVDWSLPEYADVSEEYGKFSENNAARPSRTRRTTVLTPGRRWLVPMYPGAASASARTAS